MLKILGLLMLVTSTTMYGKEMSLKLYKNIKKAQQLERFLLFFENNIHYLRKPLEEILYDIIDNDYFLDIKFLREINCTKYENIKEEFIYKLQNSDENITPNIKNILKDFFYHIGSFSVEEEIKKISYYKELLKNEIEILKEEKNKNSKVYTGVGFFAGVLFSIFVM